jgi:hypothetical protein
MEETTQNVPTMTEFQELALKLKEAKAKSQEAWNVRGEALQARNKAIENMPEQIAFNAVDEVWYELQNIEDELQSQWEKACDAIGGLA